MRRPAWLSRWKLVALAGALGLGSRGGTPSVPRSVDGVATLLGQAIEGSVRPGEFVWEAPSNLLEELFLGRRVLFPGARSGAPRDLYRARIRLSMEGHPLSVENLHNLTNTPLGDEVALAADGLHATRHVAFATTAYGKVASVTLLDLEGDGGIVGARNALERLQGKVSNLVSVGSWGGVGRADFSFENPVPSIRLGLQRGKLLLQTPENPPVTYDLARGSFDEGAEEVGVTAQRQPHLRKASILWAVDTVRGVIGSGPIAWLEETFFGARDLVRRAGYRMTTSTPAAVDQRGPPPSPPLDASAAGDDGGYWPPARLPSIWQAPEPQEGAWEPVALPFLKKLPGAGVPPYFYRTSIKPDPKRPYAQVLIVALDMRQLELNMEGGVEDPMPLTGTKSFGRIPREPEVLSRVVGAFNGAFKTTHGAYGMMVNRRVLLPPKAGAATVVVTEDRRVGLGAWGPTEQIPDDLLSFRQNLDPLVLDGQFNPTGRLQWGFQLAGHSVLTERSGICVTRPGHFFYFWGDDVSGITLGKAMIQAGCVAGMHLDMNPKHTGFVFTDIRDIKKKDYDTRLLSPQMEILPDRFIEWSPKDFFYIMLRDTGAQASGQVSWSPAAGAQPAPSWLPGLWEAQDRHGDTPVKLLAIDAGRVQFRVRPGRQDSSSQELPQDEARRVIAALGLANGRRPRGLGLVVNGKLLSTHKGGMAYLAVDPQGALRISHGEPPSGGFTDLVELPPLLLNGNLSLNADTSGPPRPRSAACVLPSGRAIFALSTAPSDGPNARVLARLGCRTAVALDRGTHEDAWLQRAGAENSAVPRGEHTTLYAVGTPMRPRAFPWAP
jgi:hypothetical protein